MTLTILSDLALFRQWFLNESSESVIQLPINKDSHLLRSWMNQPFKRIIWTNESVIKSVTCHHLLAVYLIFISFVIISIKQKFYIQNVIFKTLISQHCDEFKTSIPPLSLC